MIHSHEDLLVGTTSKRQRSAVCHLSTKMQRIDHAEIVVGVQCKHELLLATAETGKVYQWCPGRKMLQVWEQFKSDGH